MTFFLKQTTLKPWRSWIENNWIPLTVFAVLLIHGSWIGLSDDEAYYWALAQHPAFGYAYHPPAVAWVIAFFQNLLGWAWPFSASGLVRLPAAGGAALILGTALFWLKDAGLKKTELNRAAFLLLSFAGFFSLAWMMVPDIPLLVGWTLLFSGTWKICFSKEARLWDFGILFFSVGLVLLSKYSGILAIFSSGVSFLLWSHGKRRRDALITLIFGTLISLIPVLIWNANHEWASLLYQIRERHGDGKANWLRYLRFWLIEIVVAGPVLIGFFFLLLKKLFQLSLPKTEKTRIWYFGVWILPAALVFCIQPLFADFKPHWAFVVWWPTAIAFAWKYHSSQSRWISFQRNSGLALGAFVLLSCHLPVGGWIGSHFSKGDFDPRLDVTNDLYGWNDLSQFLRSQFSEDMLRLPVVGSRYQTASQAAFSLQKILKVSLIPRDVKERDEWISLPVFENQGPAWPKLKSPVLFVTDNRYTAAPEFPQAKCERVGKFEKKRFNLLVKWIEIWRCDPLN